MEEKKVKETKAPEKMSYEQLNNIAMQLSEQNKQLIMRLQEADIENVKTRITFLFKVLKYAEMFNIEFVDKCVAEIEDLITLPEEPKETEEK